MNLYQRKIRLATANAVKVINENMTGNNRIAAIAGLDALRFWVLSYAGNDEKEICDYELVAEVRGIDIYQYPIDGGDVKEEKCK